MSKQENTWKLFAALFGLSAIWGLSFVFIKILGTNVGVAGVVFWRCLAGAFVLLPFMILQQRKTRKKIPWIPLIVVGIINVCIPWLLISWSETLIPSSTASILNATTPLWALLLGAVFFKTNATFRQFIGVCIGFIGIVILLEWRIDVLWTGAFVGVGTMLIATFCYALGSHLTKRWLNGVSVLTTATVTLFVGAIGGGLLAVRESQASFLTIDSIETVLAIIGLGCLGSGVAQVLYYYMVSAGSAQFATNVTYLIPVTAIGWGAFLLDEIISLYTLTGLLVILVGVYLASGRKLYVRPSVRKG
ncbi:DMT family transporter [Mangrovibacillus cuniculi]|uniref:DMT family transporter n=1 Tax=Mangrovibacillus cuniculi TaxID=2593652 RepID=A0A7S8HH14_9BACI|nr:DMT family transporter [Mangrovibacillus cuniculi]QPC48156.1 DMT family transporter [Mangrovibacillus cuniculi]